MFKMMVPFINDYRLITGTYTLMPAQVASSYPFFLGLYPLSFYNNLPAAMKLDFNLVANAFYEHFQAPGSLEKLIADYKHR